MAVYANHREGTLERRAEILRDARNAILREHGPGVDLDHVAHRVGTSRRQLQRVFADHAEQSFRDTLASVRMYRARQLLANTDLPIAKIGRLVGYVEAAQFTKAFRYRNGMAPREYRRRAAQQRAANGAASNGHAANGASANGRPMNGAAVNGAAASQQAA